MQDYQGLVKEGPGSLWPKSTLGALVDGKRPLVTWRAGELLRFSRLDLEGRQRKFISALHF